MDEMIGKRFHNWEILNLVDDHPSKYKFYTCKCLCGKIKMVRYCHLISGLSKSCGCLRFSKNLNSDVLQKRYGKLTIIGKHFVSINSSKHIECKCDCGKIFFKRVSKLKKGGKNQGCSRSCSAVKCLKNKKFGRLLILNLSSIEFNKCVWKCKCDCGAIKKINSRDLVLGKVRSCGCLRKECSIKRLNILKYSVNLRFIKCTNCHKKISTYNKTKKYCSAKCRNNFHYKKNKSIN